MLNNSCRLQEEDRELYRLHHCGTCKAIGGKYRQSTRLFLNFDFVFLAELLTALSGEDTASWQESYHSFNCFAKDREGGEPPLALRYAATANVLLAALKTDDNLKDSPTFFWRAVKRWFDADFKKAEQEMAQFGVDMDEIWHWIACQQQREKERHLSVAREEALRYFSEPTARITALVFSKGAAMVGGDEARVFDFGFRLGELVYALDALEDVEKDRRKKQFNALQRVYQTVDRQVRQSVGEYIFSLSREMQDAIQQLPIPVARKEEFGQRLSANVAVRVANSLEEKKPVIQNLRRSLSARIALRYQNARSFAKQITQQKHPWVAAPQYAFSFLAVLVVPETAKEVHTIPGQGIAFGAVMAAFLSGLVLWPRIRRFIAIYKKELRRLRGKNRKGKPEGEDNSLKTIAWICGGLLLCSTLMVVCALIACANACEDNDEACCECSCPE